ncbi:hypothetical protein [Phyllobacterium bourgognense]|uniref:Uncharacterized protein n=1 Tax=Phyllobacterium bourgognense TaxID=314236 RepID=A0A368ZAW7_9HYPH|nr:hypothetical protein [Phyllobacterium bourgognense]RCW87604.1 hypothetical protein C7476_101370 [Phyllobacterium bourgognense]
MARNGEISADYFQRSDEEFRNARQEALWVKQLALFDGDETKAKYAYVRTRAEQLAGEQRAAVAGDEVPASIAWAVLILGFFVVWAIRAFLFLHLSRQPTYTANDIAAAVGSSGVGIGPTAMFYQMLVLHVAYLYLALRLVFKTDSRAVRIAAACVLGWFAIMAFGAYGNYLQAIGYLD